MICPTCGTHIADGLLRCPACHAGVVVTTATPVPEGRWCPSCGVAVPQEAEVCPHCGLPLESAWGTPAAKEESEAPEEHDGVASREDAETDEASAESPRIESAIPAEDDPTSKVAVLDQMPHTKPLLIAAVASALLVGSLALLITHPWNPDQYSIRATEEADTSMAGFPGTVETLTGQDQDPDDVSSADLSGDDATFAELVEIHEKLGSYVERARENEALFRSIAFTEDLAQREEGKRKADALAIDIDNLDESLGEVDVSSGTYAEEHTHLVALNDWLRTYVTSLCVAWDADVDSENPQEDEAALLLLLESDYDEGNMSRHLELFEKNYENWKPQQKAAE